MVSDGLTPGFAEMVEPSRHTAFVAEDSVAVIDDPAGARVTHAAAARMCAVVGMSKMGSVNDDMAMPRRAWRSECQLARFGMLARGRSLFELCRHDAQPITHETPACLRWRALEQDHGRARPSA